MLWTWTSDPLRINSEANPMICPYFRTGSPGEISPRATLCPSPIGSSTSTVRPPTSSPNPFGIGRAATATLSSPRSKTARRPSLAVAMIKEGPFESLLRGVLEDSIRPV